MSHHDSHQPNRQAPVPGARWPARHRPGGNAAQVPALAKVQPRHPPARPVAPVPGKLGGQPGPSARQARYRHPENVPPRQPPAQPAGSSSRRPVASLARRPGKPGTDIRKMSHPDSHQLNRQTPAPSSRRPAASSARRPGAPRWPAPAAWSSRRPAARRPRCHTTTATSPTGRLQFQAPRWPAWPVGQASPVPTSGKCHTTTATSPTGRLQFQAPGGQPGTPGGWRTEP